MNICKKCGKKINLTVAGMPDDICWGCFQNKDEVINANVNKHACSTNHKSS